MRDLKFRVWIAPDPEYDEPGQLVFPVWTGLPIDGDHTFEFEVNKEGDRSEYLCNEGVWMQYTGVKDKHGKEIYEGDVVEAWDRGRKATFEVRWRSDAAPMWILWPAYQHGEFWHLSGPEDVSAEVIGNVYENPDLAPKR